ncbi:MAG: universal stress protein [Polyangiaceae bacterium]
MSIVCATDFSNQADAALRVSAALATATGDEELWLVHALRGGRDASSDLVMERELAERRLATGVQRFSELGSHAARSSLLYGAPASSVAEFGVARNASVIVVSSGGHARSPLRKLGGVSERLALASKNPLLVVRAAEPFEAWLHGDRALRVLVAVDQSSSWEASAALIDRLRRHRPCDVVVAHLYYANEERARRGLPPLHQIVGPDPELEEILVREMKARLPPFGGEGAVDVRAVRAVGRLGDHLVELSRELAVDLVALGSRQRRGLSRFSSVSSVALHFSHASVLLTPSSAVAHTTVRPPRVVLVPTDLSQPSQRALMQAYALVEGRHGARVVLFHAEPLPAFAEEARRKLLSWVPDSERATTTVEVVSSAEDPAREICDAAERHAADLVCMTSYGRGGLTRAVVGSVTDRVVRKSHRPVLVVHPSVR